jgi:hypothetical protein
LARRGGIEKPVRLMPRAVPSGAIGLIVVVLVILLALGKI